MALTRTKQVVVSDPSRIVTLKQYGIWDYYEEVDPDAENVTMFSRAYHGAREAVNSFPYVLRAANDILAIPGCKLQMTLYMFFELTGALVPAVSTW